MKNILLSFFALYGLSVSAVSAYGLFVLDMPALEHAVSTRSLAAEERHRINVAAEGNWILLGNLITVIALAHIQLARHGNKDDQA